MLTCSRFSSNYCSYCKISLSKTQTPPAVTLRLHHALAFCYETHFTCTHWVCAFICLSLFSSVCVTGWKFKSLTLTIWAMEALMFASVNANIVIWDLGQRKSFCLKRIFNLISFLDDGAYHKVNNNNYKSLGFLVGAMVTKVKK